MKTVQAGAVVLLGLVLAAPVWGHSDEANYREVLSWFADWDRISRLSPERHGTQVYFQRGAAGSLHAELYATEQPPSERSMCHSNVSCAAGFAVGTITDGTFRMLRVWDRARTAGVRISTDGVRRTVAVTLPEYGTEYVALVFADKLNSARVRYFTYLAHAHYTTPSAPEPPAPPPEPEPETPTPPEPETPEPPSPPPEPPEPPEPSPDEGCDHVAIVPAMPRALAGDEGTPDHWLRITNPGGEGITFTVMGRNDAGTEFGTYRRELPAYRSVKVLMRDVEAAFDVSEPEGWWTLTVTGSGTQYTSATMKQGDARRFVPVVRPSACGTAVTRAGAQAGR